MAFFGLFASSRALRVTDAGITSLSEDLRLHPNQQCSRTWHIAAGTNAEQSYRLTKLVLETPGLTRVSVRPDRFQNQPDAVARIVASSDAAHHLERMDLAIKHKSELRIEFKNGKATPLPLGSLVVEIELAHASLIEDIKASGGGDVVVDYDSGAVLARGDNASISIVALDCSRLFLHIDGTGASASDTATPLAVENLRVASVSGGSVFLTSTTSLLGRKQVIGLVLGDGRIAINAPRIETRELVVAIVGERAHAQIQATSMDGVAATRAETVVWGSGSILVQSPMSQPQYEVDQLRVPCEHLKIEMNGPGCVDIAAIASQETHVRASNGGRAVVQTRERLSMTCETHASVECIGTALPSRVDPAPAHIPATMLFVTAFENRVWTASEPVPEAPTTHDMFTSPRSLQITKAGFRETLRPLWTLLQSNRSATGNTTTDPDAATPSWVHVMSDVAGGKSIH